MCVPILTPILNQRQTPSHWELPPSVKAVTMPQHLLTLPRELRDQIYTYFLSGKAFLPYDYRYEVRLRDNGFRNGGQHDTRVIRFEGPEYQLSTALLRTCKQIHDESTEMLYGRNVFAFRLATLMREFLSSVPDKHLDKIRKITLDLGLCHYYGSPPSLLRHDADLDEGPYFDRRDEAVMKFLRNKGNAEMVEMAAGRECLRELSFHFTDVYGTLGSADDFVAAADLFFEGRGLRDSWTRAALTDFGRRGGLLTFSGLSWDRTGKRVQRMADYRWKRHSGFEPHKGAFGNFETYSGLEAV